MMISFKNTHTCEKYIYITQHIKIQKKWEENTNGQYKKTGPEQTKYI